MHTPLIVAVVTFALVLGAAPGLAVALPATGYPTLGVNFQRTGQLSTSTDHLDGKVLWTYAQTVPYEGGGEASEFAVGPDGTVYMVDFQRVRAFDAAGKNLWSFFKSTDVGHPSAPPTLSDAGILYAPMEDKLRAFDPAGKVLWTAVTGNRHWVSAPLIHPDGTIVSWQQAGHLVALDAATGAQKWKWSPQAMTSQGKSDVTPAMAPDGTVYVPYMFSTGNTGDLAGVIAAVGTDGAQTWEYKFDAQGTPTNPSVGPDGTVYVAAAVSTGFTTPKTMLHAFNPDGSLKWKVEALTSPRILTDGTLVTRTNDSLLFLEAATGATKKAVATDAGKGSGGLPLFGKDGSMHGVMVSAVYDYTQNGYPTTITGYAADGTVKWTSPGFLGSTTGVAFAPDGTLYYSDGQNLTAIGGKDGAKAPTSDGASTSHESSSAPTGTDAPPAPGAPGVAALGTLLALGVIAGLRRRA